MEVDFVQKIGCHAGSVPRGIDKKNNVRSFIYGQRSTSRAYFVKIGPVDVEIIGVKEITNNVYFKKQQRNLSMRGAGGGDG